MVAFKLVRKFAISSILAAMLMTSSNASLGDFIKNQLNGSLEVTDAGYYKTQSGGLWTGGGLRVRWDMSGANINLFHAEAPHFAVGCNGIDMTFGSFSYLSFDKLVEKLKKISAAAPAMAFQMAIMTLCEQCNTIMTNLEKIADSLNNFNLNACQATRMLAGKGASFITNLLSSSGATQDASATRTKVKTDTQWAITTALQNASNWFGSLGEEGVKDKLAYGSLINRLSKTYNPQFDSQEFQAIMRAITGDIYGYSPKSTDKSGVVHQNPSKIQIIPPKSVDGSKLIKALIYGGDIPAIVLNDNCQDNICYKLNELSKTDFQSVKDEKGVLDTSVNINISSDDSFFNFIKTKISTILTKLKSKQSFTSDEIKFINSMPLPVYKIVNLVASLNLGDSDMKGVEEYLSYRILQSFLDDYFNEINRAVLSLSTNQDLVSTYNKEALQQWKERAYKNIRTIKAYINQRLMEANKKVQLQNDLLNKFASLEKEMYKQSSIWSANGL